jgi:hypothetical protein
VNINAALAIIFTLLFPVFVVTMIWMTFEVGMEPIEALGIGVVIGQFSSIMVLIYQFYFRKKTGGS